MNRNVRRGFSLMELMGVVGIIFVILTMVVPQVMAARIRANEVSALKSISAIHTAQAQYQSQTNRFAVALPELGKVMSKKLLNGRHSGYQFVLEGTKDGYLITATPEKIGGTGNRTYRSDETLSVQDEEGREVGN